MVRDPTKLVLFASTTNRLPGNLRGIEDNWRGAHMAIPPIVAETRHWGVSPDYNSDTVLAAFDDPFNEDGTSPLPVARYTDQAAVLHADLHTEPLVPGVLDDQQFWVNSATKPTWKHKERADGS